MGNDPDVVLQEIGSKLNLEENEEKRIVEVIFEIKEDLLEKVLANRKTTVMKKETDAGPVYTKSFVVMDFTKGLEEETIEKTKVEPELQLKSLKRVSQNQGPIESKKSIYQSSKSMVQEMQKNPLEEKQTGSQLKRRDRISTKTVAVNDKEAVSQPEIRKSTTAITPHDAELANYLEAKKAQSQLAQNELESVRNQEIRKSRTTVTQQDPELTNYQDIKKSRTMTVNDTQLISYLETKKSRTLIDKQSDQTNLIGTGRSTLNIQQREKSLYSTRKTGGIQDRPMYHEFCKREDFKDMNEKRSLSKSLKRSDSTPNIRRTFFDKNPNFVVKQYRKIADYKTNPVYKPDQIDGIFKGNYTTRGSIVSRK